MDTSTGLPRKLGWTVALWALALLQVIIISLQAWMATEIVAQGVKISRIEGRLGVGMIYQEPITGVVMGNNRYSIPIDSQIP